MIKVLATHIKEYKKVSLLTPLFTSLEVVMDVLIPWVTASLIDKGIMAGNMQQVMNYGALMVVMALLSLAFGIAAGRCSATAATGFAANLRKAMYRNIQSLSFTDIDRFSTSGLVTRMTTDVNNLQNAFQQILRVTVRAPFRLFLSVVMCLLIDARLSVIFIVAMAVLAASLYKIITRVAELFSHVFEQYDSVNQSVQENIQGIRVVKAFVREDYETRKFSKAAEGLYRLYVGAESMMALNHPVMNLVVYGCMIALSWWGAHFIVGGTLTTGELTSLFTYVMSILQSLMMLSMIFVMLTQSAASGRRVAEILNYEPSIRNGESPRYEVRDGSVELRKVRFDYHSEESQDKLSDTISPAMASLFSPATAPHRKSALYDVSFKIESGETIGVIGGTGSGKSTLVNLVSRLYDVNQGEVLVGGVNVKHYDLKSLRNAVSVVLQQNMLFSGTVIDNLRWGKADATEEECRRACRLACADEFVETMPDGYHSKIEQGGSNLSGGQKQRLCIARALLKTPKILVLDDSTSACDNSTDMRIQQALRSQLPTMTKLIIAQRISTVKECDRIIVMDNGMVTGFDTHDALLKTNPIYQEICAIQNEGNGDFDESRQCASDMDTTKQDQELKGGEA
jgi:ATP-binding cassette subfamily B protein